MNSEVESIIEAARKRWEKRYGRVLYGWEHTSEKPVRDPKTGEIQEDIHGNQLMEQLPVGCFLKKFTHLPGTGVLGAAKRGGYWAKFELKPLEDIFPSYKSYSAEEKRRIEKWYRRRLKRKNQCKPVRYVVWHDRSLRSVDNVLRKQFASMPIEQQQALIAKAVGIAKEAQAA